MQKVSLILTTYNSKENFLKTYTSIRQQDYPDIEIVVIDGGSTDGTVSEIQKCAEQESGRMKWISEMYISEELTIPHGQSDHLSRRFRSLISERDSR